MAGPVRRRRAGSGRAAARHGLPGRAGRRRPGCAAVERRPIGRRGRRADHRPGRRRRGGRPAGMGRRRGTVPVAWPPSPRPSSAGWPTPNRTTPTGRRPSACPTTGSPGGCPPTAASTPWSPTAATRAAPPTGRRARRVPGRPAGTRPARPPPRRSPGRRAGRAVGVLAGATAVLGPGTGDNAAAALGLAARPGDVVVSIGTSGSSPSTTTAVADVTGTVAGFADATGHHLPLVATLNAARVLDAAATLLGVDHAMLSDLALSAPSGAGGLVLVPYLEGERTPNLPRATGAVHGLTLRTSTPAYWARPPWRACCAGWPDGIEALVAQGCPSIGCCSSVVAPRPPRCSSSRPASSVGRSWSRRRVSTSPTVPPGRPWVLAGTGGPPSWAQPGLRTFEAPAAAGVRERYAECAGAPTVSSGGGLQSGHRPGRPFLAGGRRWPAAAPHPRRGARVEPEPGTRTTRAGSAGIPTGPPSPVRAANRRPSRQTVSRIARQHPDDTARGGRLKSS